MADTAVDVLTDGNEVRFSLTCSRELKTSWEFAIRRRLQVVDVRVMVTVKNKLLRKSAGKNHNKHVVAFQNKSVNRSQSNHVTTFQGKNAHQ